MIEDGDDRERLAVYMGNCLLDYTPDMVFKYAGSHLP
jgi:hypothetical protein